MQLAEADGLGLAEADLEADAEEVADGEVDADAGAELPAVREGEVEAGSPAACEDACADAELVLGLAEADADTEGPVEDACEDEPPAAAPPELPSPAESEACGSAMPVAGALEAPGVAGAVALSVVSASTPRPPNARMPTVLNASTLLPRERLRRRPRPGPGPGPVMGSNGSRSSPAGRSPYRVTEVGSRITSSAVGRSPTGRSPSGRSPSGRSGAACSVVLAASGANSSAGRPHPGQFRAPLSRRRHVEQ